MKCLLLAQSGHSAFDYTTQKIMNISGILAVILFLAFLLIYAVVKLIALRSLNNSELELYRSSKKFSLIAVIVIGAIGFIVLIFNRKSDWGLILSIGLVILSILQTSLHIKMLKNMSINESAKKKFILVEPVSILVTITLVAIVLL